MKEHEKSFCRARVAFEENRKLKGDEQEESNSGEHSPVSVSPPPSSTQEAVSIPLSTRFELTFFDSLFLGGWPVSNFWTDNLKSKRFDGIKF